MDKNSIVVTTPEGQEEIYFNDGILSCKGKTCCKQSTIWTFISGCTLGALILLGLSYYGMRIGNYQIIDADISTTLSTEGAMKLKQSGIKWDVKNRDWVTDGKKFVTKLSPSSQKPLK